MNGMGHIFEFAIKTMRKWTYQIGNQSKIILLSRDLTIVYCVGHIVDPFNGNLIIILLLSAIPLIILFSQKKKKRLHIIVFVNRTEFLRNHQIQKIEK